jgi:hypothetical protein
MKLSKMIRTPSASLPMAMSFSAVFFAFLCLIPFISFQAGAVSDISAQLNAIQQEYLEGPDVAGLVTLDGKMRTLLHEPWRRSGQSIDGKLFQPGWTAIGVDVAHYSDALEYSGKLLVKAHRKNPASEFRRFTLFSAILGERPSHGLGEMPNVNVALQYLKEFPRGPFARDVAIILGDFYSDLFKMMVRLQGKEPRGYKQECFEKYITGSDLGAQAATARRLSVSYYAQALATAPAGWRETIDLKKRHSVMEGGDPELIELLGWHFCAD